MEWDSLDFFNVQFVTKYRKKFREKKENFEKKKISKWDPLEIKKFEKKSNSAEINSKGDSIVSSGFVSYLKNGVNERGSKVLLNFNFT